MYPSLALTSLRTNGVSELLILLLAHTHPKHWHYKHVHTHTNKQSICRGADL